MKCSRWICLILLRMHASYFFFSRKNADHFADAIIFSMFCFCFIVVVVEFRSVFSQQVKKCVSIFWGMPYALRIYKKIHYIYSLCAFYIRKKSDILYHLFDGFGRNTDSRTTIWRCFLFIIDIILYFCIHCFFSFFRFIYCYRFRTIFTTLLAFHVFGGVRLNCLFGYIYQITQFCFFFISFGCRSISKYMGNLLENRCAFDGNRNSVLLNFRLRSFSSGGKYFLFLDSA